MKWLASPTLACVALVGCASTTLDEPELRSAAEARQRAAGLAVRSTSRDVRALLARPLTADTAAQIAVLNNAGLRASLEELTRARSNLASVRRLPNPTVEGAVRFKRAGETEIEVGALLDLTELALALPRGGAAASAVEAAKLSAIGAILEHSFQAREAFFEYQAALQMLELRQTVVEALEASAEIATRLHDAGNITELSRSREQAAFHEARLDLQRAEAALASARERLNATLGLWGADTEWRADSRLPDPPEQELPLDTLEQEAVRRSLDLEAAKQRFGAAAKRANVARAAGLLPELKAGISAERDEEHWGVGPALEIEVPLFYQGQGEVALARAEMRQEQARHTDLAIRLRASAREVATRLRAAREAVAYYRAVLLPTKQRIVNEAQLQYNAMAIGVFQLIQAKRDQIQTASAYIEQLREYWLARTRAERLLSGRFTALSTGDAGQGLGAPEPSGRSADAH